LFSAVFYHEDLKFQLKLGKNDFLSKKTEAQKPQLSLKHKTPILL